MTKENTKEIETLIDQTIESFLKGDDLRLEITENIEEFAEYIRLANYCGGKD